MYYVHVLLQIHSTLTATAFNIWRYFGLWIPVVWRIVGWSTVWVKSKENLDSSTVESGASVPQLKS